MMTSITHRPPQFSATQSAAVTQGVQPWLKASGFTRYLDAQKLGGTTRNQSQVIYTLMVISRLVAAAIRGHEIGNYREVFEHATRDIVGWAMFFFGASTLVRAFAKVVAPKTWKQVMTAPTEQWVNKPFMGQKIADESGVLAKVVRSGRRTFHTLFKSDLLSDDQISSIRAKTIKAYKKSGNLPTQTIEALDNAFKNKVALRNGLSAMGLVVNIALMGIAIPLINIIVTKKQVAESKHAQQTIPKSIQQLQAGLQANPSTYSSDFNATNRSNEPAAPTDSNHTSPNSNTAPSLVNHAANQAVFNQYLKLSQAGG
jgi:hypothetical protein